MSLCVLPGPTQGTVSHRISSSFSFSRAVFLQKEELIRFLQSSFLSGKTKEDNSCKERYLKRWENLVLFPRVLYDTTKINQSVPSSCYRILYATVRATAQMFEIWKAIRKFNILKSQQKFTIKIVFPKLLHCLLESTVINCRSCAPTNYSTYL